MGWFDEMYRRNKRHLLDPRLAGKTLLSFGLFLVAIFGIQPLAIDFANESASNPVTDIILSNTPVFDVGIFFVYGMFLLVAFITLLCLWWPQRRPFVLYSLTLFVLVRSIFVSLTHVGTFTSQIESQFGPAITNAFYGADHFFSGHAGSPFLMALIFWQDRGLRYIFLLWSAFFSVIVLLGHLHYTIDVLAAFFITYGIFHIAQWILPGEWTLFNQKN